MRFSLDLEIKAADYYGPYDLFVSGVWVARRKYDGSSEEDMAAEFIAHLGAVVAGDSMWSTSKPQSDEDSQEYSWKEPAP